MGEREEEVDVLEVEDICGFWSGSVLMRCVSGRNIGGEWREVGLLLRVVDVMCCFVLKRA